MTVAVLRRGEARRIEELGVVLDARAAIRPRRGSREGGVPDDVGGRVLGEVEQRQHPLGPWRVRLLGGRFGRPRAPRATNNIASPAMPTFVRVPMSPPPRLDLAEETRPDFLSCPHKAARTTKPHIQATRRADWPFVFAKKWCRRSELVRRVTATAPTSEAVPAVRIGADLARNLRQPRPSDSAGLRNTPQRHQLCVMTVVS